MEHIIIGTAGHIDHGKTALIRALTGRETDTGKEEKQRGITIDLGFTYFDLPGGMRAGIIDVPGHEKFLPNMLAGVCGMDLVLLTIALDEGIMPQTREHLDILEQLGIKRGILVLTKLDMVEEEWAEMMEEEIKDELKGRIFSSWEMISVSAKEGTNIEELKHMVVKMASTAVHDRDVSGHFRLPVDRLFTVKGLGTVVAGTVLESSIRVEQEVMLYPAGKLTKIRSLQTHGEPVEEVYAGQRAALLISGIAKEEVHRGMVLAYPDSIRPVNRLDVSISLSSDCNRVVKNQSKVHLHIGSDEVIARVILLDVPELHAGESGFAQLVTEREVCVKRNDKFVIRFLSPLETLGGGIVLQIDAKKHHRFDQNVIATLAQRKEGKEEQLIVSTINDAVKAPLSLSELESQVQMGKEELMENLQSLVQEDRCCYIPGRKQPFYWSFGASEEKTGELTGELMAFHQAHPYKPGILRAVLKSKYFKGWNTAAVDAYFEYLIAHQKLNAKDEFVWNCDFEIVEDDYFTQLSSKVKDAAKEAGFALYDYAPLLDQNDSNAEDVMDSLIRMGQLVRIHDTIVTTTEIARAIREKVISYFAEEEILSFATLRDLLNVSRKAAKPLMAYLDDCQITMWCGKETERKFNKNIG
ncbi:MAG: selenocysteine-specific translation elongation factor [Lachnospiraceae bacterium]|nr:selenocysteine-specific translation elongation factor [Lachnospiraceae bacterium]